MTTFPFTRFDYTGATTYSPIGFEYEDPSQVQVIIADQMGRPQTLTFNLDYTVDRSDDSITLSPDRHWDVEPEKVFVMRNTAVSDSPVFHQGVYLDVRKVQQALETMRLQISEVKMSADNSIKLSAQDWHREGADNPVTIPPADKRAGRILAFDDDGNVLMVLTTDIEQKLQDALQAETNSVAIKESVDEAKAEVLVALAESLSTVNRAKAEADKAYEHSIQASIHEAGALSAMRSAQSAEANTVELNNRIQGYNDLARQWVEGPAPSGYLPGVDNNARYLSSLAGTYAEKAGKYSEEAKEKVTGFVGVETDDSPDTVFGRINIYENKVISTVTTTIDDYIDTNTQKAIQEYIDENTGEIIDGYVTDNVKPDLTNYTETTIKPELLSIMETARQYSEAAEESKVNAEESEARSLVSETNAKASEDSAEDYLNRIRTVIGSVYKYKGSVATVDDLPTDAIEGDVYNVESSKINYAWNGSEWDSFGDDRIDMTQYYTRDEVNVIASGKYVKPSDGIPKTDMTESVQNSLDKADSSPTLDMIYPVGAIYMSVNATSPASLFGGVWEAITDRFLIGASSTYEVESTGGSSTHYHTTGGHTLTTSEIPAHTHGSVSDHTHGRGSWDISGTITAGYANGTNANGTSAFSSALSGKKIYASSSSYGTYSGVTHTFTASKGWSGTMGGAGGHTHTSVGSGGSHSHGDTGSTSTLPPYLAVYMWKRTE